MSWQVYRNLPLLLQLLGSEKGYVLLLAVPILMYFGWVGAKPAGSLQVYLIALRLLERRTGRPLRAMYEEELTELRRGFWFSRWLCGPLPQRAEATPAPNSKAALRRETKRGRR